MGVWGRGLYENDISDSIKTEFIEKLRLGKTIKEATEEMIDEYAECLVDIDDADCFWFALADTQWNLGMLQINVKEETLKRIEAYKDLEQHFFEKTVITELSRSEECRVGTEC